MLTVYNGIEIGKTLVYSISPTYSFIRESKVVRLTANQVTLENGYKFSLKTGKRICGGIGGYAHAVSVK